MWRRFRTPLSGQTSTFPGSAVAAAAAVLIGAAGVSEPDAGTAAAEAAADGHRSQWAGGKVGRVCADPTRSLSVRSYSPVDYFDALLPSFDGCDRRRDRSIPVPVVGLSRAPDEPATIGSSWSSDLPRKTPS